MEEENNMNTNKTISQPPLDVLFNPSLVSKKDVWEIDVVMLLEMLLKIINLTGKKDLRVCGIAALSSSLIHRLKVESIFRLEKIAMSKKSLDITEIKKIPLLKSVEIPFRIESNYPVSLEDLLSVLENMIANLANPRRQRSQLNLDTIPSFDFNEYIVKFEEIIKSYEEMIIDILTADGSVLFSSLTLTMNTIDTVRCFLAVLYLAMKREIIVTQSEDQCDFTISRNTD
jgi:segregation and condensation protein A